ncbi:MAG TPA: O-antigen ligase family protein [Thermoanaerobaculia bacterium]|nr:O-antigen ligase family protein [Thermoanaerobaculia bacterium]
MIRHSSFLLAGFLVLLLVFAPLPFGGVTPWAQALLRGLCFAALALAAAALDRPAALRPALVPAAVLAALALLGVLQAAPLPAGLVAAVSPEHASFERQSAELSGAPSVPRLTLAAVATRSAALGWAAVAAAFLAAAVAGRHRELRRWLAGALVAGALFQVFFGARDWFAHARTLWGVELQATALRLRGTFVNPNHLASYLEMALPVVFAWGWWAARRAADQPQMERRLLLAAPPALVWLTVFAGLSFTGSRGGLLAAVAAVTVQGVLMARDRRRRWVAPLGALAALAGLAVVASVGLREGLGRLLGTTVTDVSLGARLREYRAVLELWGRFPATGVGLGAFRDGFPLVQPAVLEGTFWHPHSGPLEVLATAGLVGAALLAAGLAALVRRLAAVLRDGGRSEDRAAALAAFGILTSLGIHEALDFGLTMPGNAVTLAVLLGSAAAAKTRTRSAQLERAGEDLPAAGAPELQDVKPAAEPHRHPKSRHGSRKRRQRKSAQGRAVET